MANFTYPFPDHNNQTFIDLMSYNNTVTDGAFGLSILLMVFMIVFITLKRYPPEQGFAVASVITTLASFFLSIMSVIPANVTAIPFVMALISLFFLKKGD